MSEGLLEAVVYWHWLALAVALFALEIIVPGVFLIFLGLASAVVGVVLLAIPDLDWRLQLVLFAALAVTLIFIGRRVYGRMSESEDHTSLNRRGERLVGQSFPLAGAMVGGRGRLRVGDQIVEINGVNTRDMTHGEAIDLIKSGGAAVRLLVRRGRMPPAAIMGEDFEMRHVNI